MVVMFLGVLMLNFMVAFTTARATNMSEYRDTIIILNRLLASVIIETRLGKHLPRYFDKYRRKNMKVTEEDQVFLLTMKRVESLDM